MEKGLHRPCALRQGAHELAGQPAGYQPERHWDWRGSRAGAKRGRLRRERGHQLPASAITLTNSGNASLAITSITISGANASDFTQSDTCGSSVAAGGTCTINVIFEPSAAGTRSAALSIADTIGHNSFRGPHYLGDDVSLAKNTKLPEALHLGEAANLEIRVNFFNIFNKLNIAPFQFSDNSSYIGNVPNFGVATAGLAGRVIEFQGRINF